MSEAPPDGSQVNRWLSFAAQPHLKELDVNTSEAINLESFVYIGYGDLYDYDFASCKQLTHLSMTGAHFDCDEEFKNINSGFPLLESFTMIDCDLVDRRHQYLKVLVLEKYEDWAGQVKTKISIDAPILVSFGYHSRHALLQIVVNSPNLLDATITLDFFWNVRRME
ncbi:hypothetical protein TIFTF001_022481 [Ficus carica]|uniref:Uncharacterized protein n=1 Tax=Ficus carica TaxID=3494 RepID=A0AA88DFJ7_FICCA|nr:hypothetical protein TIFTF001_022481 [Ficus carica]